MDPRQLKPGSPAPVIPVLIGDQGVDKSLWAKPPRMPKPVERMVPERGYDKKGTPLYMVADLALLIERREDESRRGPKVRDTLTKAV